MNSTQKTAKKMAAEVASELVKVARKRGSDFRASDAFKRSVMTVIERSRDQMIHFDRKEAAAEFTFETGTPGERMRRKAIHAALDILLDEDDRFLSLAMTKPGGSA